MDSIRAEAVRTMYAQIRTTGYAAIVITTYMCAVSLPFTPWRTVFAWAILPLAGVLMREGVVRAFQSRAPADAAMQRWADAMVLLQMVVGLVWGLTMVLFVHVAQPITIALTLCCLYSIAAGAVTSSAYYPRAIIGLVAVMFGIILVRMAITGEFVLILVGITSALFGVTMIGYCFNQSRAVFEALRIRFENAELLKALAVEKAEADDARHEAERASLAKTQFLAAASHDLRQPLYALSLFSASLDELRLDAEGRTVVGNIQDSIGVMESLFDGLLDISKLDAGVVKPHFAAVSVDAVFDRLSQVFRPIAIERGLELRFRSDGEWIESDAQLLEQVLANLVANALRYTEQGGVLVAARARSSRVSLEVWDTGRGISTADGERIFEEFVQLDNLERDRRKGLGLGLSIAQRSAMLIGSRIALASRVGRGTRFAIIQSRTEPPSRSAAKTPLSLVTRGDVAASRKNDRPVLIVDDDRDVREALSDLLRRWNVRFEAVAEAEVALERVGAGEVFGLVLADYRLGGRMNGLELIVALRKAHVAPCPDAVLITGDFDASLIAAADRHHVPVLHKPLKPAVLRRLLGLDERN